MNIVCFHCHQELNINNEITANIDNKKQSFCCNGCIYVCQMLHNNNLTNFYQQQKGIKKLKFNTEYPLEYYDMPYFKDEFVRNNKIILISQSIHCAACVWLIEKIIAKIKGVVSVRVNLTNSRIVIELTDNIKLSAIFKKLAELGYSSQPFIISTLEKIQQEKNKKMLFKLGFAAFSMMNLLWISVALYSGADHGKYNNYFIWLSFIFATPTLFYSGFDFLRNSYFTLKNFTLSMDVPIAIGATATYFYSVMVLLQITKGHIYFDTVVNFIFIILIGRYLESASKKAALSDIDNFNQLQVKFALLVTKNKEQLVPVRLLKKGDIIIVKSGMRIAVDGFIVEGNISVDESILTGESLAIDKKINDKVFAGTLNLNGSANIVVEEYYTNSTISKINQMIIDAGNYKSNIICTIDKIIPYFVLSTIFLAVTTFIYHFLNTNLELALLYSVAVLIITCPCAFGIAVPISNAVAASTALNNKIIIKNYNILDKLPQIDTVVFDKTGTLTTGKFSVVKISNNINKDNYLKIITSIAKHSEHPLAKSIIKHIKKYKYGNFIISDFIDTKSMGLSATINNKRYYLGNLTFTQQLKQSKAKNFNPPNDSSIVWLSDKKNILGYIAFSDVIKKEAKNIISTLHKMNKKIIMLTGDNENTANIIANQLNITTVIANATVTNKTNYIKKLQQKSTVLMIGDGINDTPSLSVADCSIAITGIDMVATQADAVTTLAQIIKLFKLAKITKKTINQSIVFSLLYNAIMIPLAMSGFITPLFAAIVMPISSIIVISNAILLKYKK